MPNCPVPNCPGAKLSGCQIVHFYYLGAKLSAFIILVPNCPLYYLGAKLSGAKLSYNPVGHRDEEEKNFIDFFSQDSEKKYFFCVDFYFFILYRGNSIVKL